MPFWRTSILALQKHTTLHNLCKLCDIFEKNNADVCTEEALHSPHNLCSVPTMQPLEMCDIAFTLASRYRNLGSTICKV